MEWFSKSIFESSKRKPADMELFCFNLLHKITDSAIYVYIYMFLFSVCMFPSTLRNNHRADFWDLIVLPEESGPKELWHTDGELEARVHIIYMYIYIHIHIYAYTHTRIYGYVYIYIYVHM